MMQSCNCKLSTYRDRVNPESKYTTSLSSKSLWPVKQYDAKCKFAILPHNGSVALDWILVNSALLSMQCAKEELVVWELIQSMCASWGIASMQHVHQGWRLNDIGGITWRMCAQDWHYQEGIKTARPLPNPLHWQWVHKITEIHFETRSIRGIGKWILHGSVYPTLNTN